MDEEVDDLESLPSISDIIKTEDESKDEGKGKGKGKGKGRQVE